jgi:hypothetical protein
MKRKPEGMVLSAEEEELYRDALASEEGANAAIGAWSARLSRRWKWFRAVFFASWAVWALVALLVSVARPLGIDVRAPWFPFVSLLPMLVAMVFAARSTKHLFEELLLDPPLPSLLGTVSIFPPFHTLVYWWAMSRYRKPRPS